MSSEAWSIIGADSVSVVEEVNPSADTTARPQKPLQEEARSSSQEATADNAPVDSCASTDLEEASFLTQLTRIYYGDDGLRSMNELQEVGRNLYETYQDTIQRRLATLSDVASQKSVWMFSAARAEAQRLLSLPSEAKEFGVTPIIKVDCQEDLSSHQKYDAEDRTAAVLVPELVRSHQAPFDGQDLKGWFRGVAPIFAKHLTNDIADLLHGLKVCSLPAIATIIDELDVQHEKDWVGAIGALHQYFNSRNIKMQNYDTLWKRYSQGEIN